MKILLDNVNKVKDFVDICSKSSKTIDAKSDRYTVDGKSIMGMFSLDLSQPIDICISGEDTDFTRNISKYIVEG